MRTQSSEFFNRPWPDHCVDALRSKWIKGLSATQCAVEIAPLFPDDWEGEINRSAILGKVYRLRRKGVEGFDKRKPRGRPYGTKVKKDKPVNTPKYSRFGTLVHVEREPTFANSEAFVALEKTKSKCLMDLADEGECHWPVEMIDGLQMFCAAKCTGRYCDAHKRK